MNQQCKVCGEPAAGFHFGAFTCEGCKSFFGRTYNNLASISACKNNDNCVINKKNRTACKACRLNKCVSVGMSKSGSRYGRRSNWFKIHCLLNEQREQQEKVQHQHQHQQQEHQQLHHHSNQFEQLINQSHNFSPPQSVLSNRQQEQEQQPQSITHHHHNNHNQYKSVNNKASNKTTTSPTSLLSNTYNIPSHLLTNVCKNVANKRKTPSDSGASSADLEEGNSHSNNGSIDGNNSIESAPPYIPKQKTTKMDQLTTKMTSSSSLSPLSNLASSTTNGHQHQHHNHPSAFSPVQRSNFKSLPDICYNSGQLLINHNESKPNKRSNHHHHHHHQQQHQHERHDSTSSIDEHQHHNEPIDLSLKSQKSKQTRSRSSSTSSTSDLSLPIVILNSTENNIKIPTRTSFTHFMDLPKPTPLDLTYFPNTSWMSSLLCHQNSIGKKLRISTTSEQLL